MRDHFSEMTRKKKSRSSWSHNAEDARKERSLKHKTEHNLLREVKASNAKAIADDKEALEAFYVTHPGIAAGGLSAMGMDPTSCACCIGKVPVYGTLTKKMFGPQGDLRTAAKKLAEYAAHNCGNLQGPILQEAMKTSIDKKKLIGRRHSMLHQQQHRKARVLIKLLKCPTRRTPLTFTPRK